ncbi:SAGA-associated factor 73 [Lachnellula cervina]|uniref:SAGA-associated factor 73 n=1 Tax=Lachnellula cervina TaxID=1316786 RepID=A0A7D8UT83_9HELO|nr:SAGA-associated factor 73 [Lachnellula cervina]
MAATSSKNKAALASDDESTIKVAPKKDGNPKLKLKKPAPKHSKPGNWRDGSVVDDDKKKRTDTYSTNSAVASPGPIVNQLDDAARETFATGRPLDDSLDLHICKHCKKSILKVAAENHVKQCLKLKREKAQRKKEQKEAREREKKGLAAADKDEEGDTKMEDDDDDDDASPEKKGPEGLKSTKKSAGKKVELDDTKKGKKRKADGDAEKAPKPKKKKEEPKSKAVKPKGIYLADASPFTSEYDSFHLYMRYPPSNLDANNRIEGPVDVERQCGVMKDGVPCARSLTCKSHSMGAKRAVPGRSLPYDHLLAAYQKKNQAKQQKAAIDANAPLEDEEAANGPVDSDEELQSVMHGLSNWNPQPLVQPPIHVPIEKQYLRQRLYEQLHNATNGFTVNIFKVLGDGAKKQQNGDTVMDADGDAEGEPDPAVVNAAVTSAAIRRTSGFNMQMPPQRRTSSASHPAGR